MAVTGHVFICSCILQLLLLSGTCQSLAGNGTITFNAEPADMETQANIFLRMICSVSQLPPDHHVVWTQNGEPILEDNEPIRNDSGGFTGMGYGTYSSLVIEAVAADYHGSSFTCLVNRGSLLSPGAVSTVAQSRSAILTVLYPPLPEYPVCNVTTNEKDHKVTRVVLKCCTQISSVPLSLAWIAGESNATWQMTPIASKKYAQTESCLEVDLQSGLNFSSYMCQLKDSLQKLDNFHSRQCRISKITSGIRISIRFLDHKNAQFNCSVSAPGSYQYLWHLQDEGKTQIKQVGSKIADSTLVLQMNTVSNGSYLSCAVINRDNTAQMGTTDLKIVLSPSPPSEEISILLIIGIVVGLLVGVLIIGLSVYFLFVKWRKRNDRLYAALDRPSEHTIHVGPGGTYIYHRTGANGNANGRVATVDGGMTENDMEDVPPKPGGHRTISWEPEDMVIMSNGGVISHAQDPKRRNVEGLVYADLAFKEGEEEQDEEEEEEPGADEALKGAVGGEANGSKPGTNRQNSIEYASIVPPPRSLRF